jgi:monovalent cation:proton antiporter-2 (CPA2) family protein
MSHQFLILTIIFLAAAVAAVPLAKRFGLGSILGYLIAGAVIGPFGVQIFSDVSGLLHFSEFGVVFLLFVIGLELKPSRLWVMRHSVFGVGGVQVVLTTLVFAAALMAIGLEMEHGFVLGFALSLSSTAFALQFLGERNQLTTEYGRSAFGILLFQDVAVIPALALLPLLFEGLGSSSRMSVWVGIIIVAVILAFGRHITRPIFRLIASTRSREVFTAATLLLVLAIAALMEAIGLSMALGSFLVGVLLSDSEYRHELETDIEPFKGLLLGLFFMSVGMMVNTNLLFSEPVKVLSLLVGYLILKFASLYATAKIFKFPFESSRNLSFSIVQGSEFAFVIASLLLQGQVISSEYADILIIIIALSMAVTPLLGVFNDKVLSKKFQAPPKPYDEIKNEHPEVIVAGLGRFGQIVCRLLRLRDIPFTALEQDPEQVETLRRFGNQVYYGDASRIDLLEKAGADKARYFVLAIDDVDSSLKTAQVVKEAYPHLKIFARARNRQHAFNLYDEGVNHIKRETFWSSIKLAEDLLVDWGEDRASVQKLIDVFVKHDLEMLEGQYQRRHNQDEFINFSKQAAQQLVEVIRGDKQVLKDIEPAKGTVREI